MIHNKYFGLTGERASALHNSAQEHPCRHAEETLVQVARIESEAEREGEQMYRAKHMVKHEARRTRGWDVLEGGR